MSDILCAAKINCVRLERLEEELKALEAAGVDEWHLDVTDGVFAPGFQGGIELLRVVKTFSELPCNVHLMVQDPEKHLQPFIDAKADSITVHVEASTHIHRTLGVLQDAGIVPGVAIAPATQLTKLDYVLSMVKRVLVLTTDPGAEDADFVPSAFERMRILKENIQYHKYPITLQAKGHLDKANAARMLSFGADALVLDKHNLFDGSEDYAKTLSTFRDALEVGKNLV